MTKLFFILVGIVGTFFLINAYYPKAWAVTFGAMGAHIPLALIIIAVVLVLGIVKLKSA